MFYLHVFSVHMFISNPFVNLILGDSVRVARDEAYLVLPYFHGNMYSGPEHHQNTPIGCMGKFCSVKGFKQKLVMG